MLTELIYEQTQNLKLNLRRYKYICNPLRHFPHPNTQPHINLALPPTTRTTSEGFGKDFLQLAAKVRTWAMPPFFTQPPMMCSFGSQGYNNGHCPGDFGARLQIAQKVINHNYDNNGQRKKSFTKKMSSNLYTKICDLTPTSFEELRKIVQN